MPRNILFVVPRFHPRLAGAVRVLDSAGDRVSIFATETLPDEDHSLIVPWVFGPSPRPADVARAIADTAPDLIILGEAGVLSDIVAKRATTKKIAMLASDDTPSDRRWPLVKRARHALKERPLKRITPVPDAGGRPDGRATFVPWPVFGDGDRKPRETDVGRILCIGHLLKPGAAQDRVIAALADVSPSLRWSLTLVGLDTREPEASDEHIGALRRHADASVEGQRITIRSDVAFREMADIYRAHDICVLPATGTHLGMAALEAMAFGCVPVVSQTLGASRYIDHGRNGWTYDPTEDGALARALQSALHDETKLAAMSATAIRDAREKFGPRAFLKAFEGLFDPWKVDF